MLQQADVRERMLQQGAEPAPTTPAEFTALIRNDIARWAKVIQVSGTKPD
jgi:tripartite-type tricarboxylate transporter receptor subunit TctC